jgi:hypothetical protein
MQTAMYSVLCLKVAVSPPFIFATAPDFFPEKAEYGYSFGYSLIQDMAENSRVFLTVRLNTTVIRESRPLRRCWLSWRQYRECFTYTDLRMKPLCAPGPQTNTSSICLGHGIAITPGPSGQAGQSWQVLTGKCNKRI